MPAQTLTISGGTTTDNGTITVDSNNGNSPTYLTFSGIQTLNGSGSAVLNNLDAQLNTSNGGMLTQGSTHTIMGLGTINAALINQGLVDADVNGKTLFLASNPMSSSGTMEATSGGTLSIGAIPLGNTGGTILASGGNVQIVSGGTISGGTLASTGTSNLSLSSGTATLNGIALASGSQFNILGNTTITVSNGITNNGTVTVDSNSASTDVLDFQRHSDARRRRKRDFG